MAPKRFSLKTALRDIVGGVVVGGLVGAIAVLREATRRRGDEEDVALVAGDGQAEPAAELSGERAAAPAPAPLRPGWRAVEREPLPRPTYWPAALGFGITLLAWGILTTWLISAVGLTLLIIALAGWIGELLHGH